VPEIRLIDRYLGPPEMAGLYRACDLLLHPYRGEGFGMPVLEAKACGLPVLVTDGGSTDDFCHGGASIKIPSRSRFVDLPGVHIGRPFVREPDSQALRELLQRTLRDIDSIAETARREARSIRDDYTWDRAAAALERMTFLAAAGASLPRQAPSPRWR
jgi:glycosyltransferase involved in cell wall biosynthesis